MDSFIDIDILDLIPLIVLGAVEGAKPQNIPKNTAQKGGAYLEELLSSTPNRIYDVLRMKKQTFISLCIWLQVNGGLAPTRYISVQEQVFMFLWTMNYSASNQSIEERFQHSGETVHR
jgi:hypothetical protein